MWCQALLCYTVVLLVMFSTVCEALLCYPVVVVLIVMFSTVCETILCYTVILVQWQWCSAQYVKHFCVTLWYWYSDSDVQHSMWNTSVLHCDTGTVIVMFSTVCEALLCYTVVLKVMFSTVSCMWSTSMLHCGTDSDVQHSIMYAKHFYVTLGYW